MTIIAHNVAPQLLLNVNMKSYSPTIYRVVLVPLT